MTSSQTISRRDIIHMERVEAHWTVIACWTCGMESDPRPTVSTREWFVPHRESHKKSKFIYQVLSSSGNGLIPYDSGGIRSFWFLRRWSHLPRVHRYAIRHCDLENEWRHPTKSRHLWFQDWPLARYHASHPTHSYPSKISRVDGIRSCHHWPQVEPDRWYDGHSWYLHPRGHYARGLGASPYRH